MQNDIIFQIRTAANLGQAVRAVNGLSPDKVKPFTVKICEHQETRRLKQNRLAFLWYKFMGQATGHGYKHEHHVNKLIYGVPIIRADDEVNRFLSLSLDRLTYEEQILAMEYIPVTSLMKVRQFAEYLTEVDQQAADRGINLPHPDDLYWAALMKEH